MFIEGQTGNSKRKSGEEEMKVSEKDASSRWSR